MACWVARPGHAELSQTKMQRAFFHVTRKALCINPTSQVPQSRFAGSFPSPHALGAYCMASRSKSFSFKTEAE